MHLLNTNVLSTAKFYLMLGTYILYDVFVIKCTFKIHSIFTTDFFMFFSLRYFRAVVLKLWGEATNNVKPVTLFKTSKINNLIN